jgi:hypothetical protein
MTKCLRILLSVWIFVGVTLAAVVTMFLAFELRSGTLLFASWALVVVGLALFGGWHHYGRKNLGLD